MPSIHNDGTPYVVVTNRNNRILKFSDVTEND